MARRNLGGVGATCAALRFDIAISMPPRWAAEGWLSGGFGERGICNLHGCLGVVHIGWIETAAQMDGGLAGAQVLAGKFQRCDQLFARRALLPAYIPKALTPVIRRWRVVVLRTHGQGPNNRVAEVALVGIVAVDAQATSAQGTDYLVVIEPLILEDDVFLGLAWGVDHQCYLGAG